MDFTKKDRIVLINQYQILKRLGSDNSSHYEELIEILESGYEIFYSIIGEQVSEEMSTSEGALVLDILSIYGLIEAYKRDNRNDAEIGDHDWSSFRGFDGNNETRYMAFTRFLVDKQGKFAEQARRKKETDDFNSHMPLLDKYRKMVEVWRGIQPPHDLSRDQILAILNA